MTHSLCDMTEIIPGYSCTERIGAGGYGEVWKVNAPGGLKKALKIVYGFVGEERAEREWKALERIKSIRHPYILSLERVEILQHRLLIVCELADCSLLDRFRECRRKSLPGIPRDELLRYLREAAEALDFLLQQHGLQHLDIKPENLLLLCDHAKVADFGLVKDLFDQAHSLVSGLTPIYAAPETFHGTASRWSDQYSLAVVYQQMLTGTLPYPGRQATQLLSQHSKLPPALTALPPDDREAVGRALQLNPEARFESCSAFIAALSTPGTTQSNAAAVPPSAPYGTTSSEKETCSMKGILTDIVRERSRLAEHTVTEKRSDEPGVGANSEAGKVPKLDVKAPKILVTTRIRRLKPLRQSALPATEPSIVIGVGGTGALVLSKLRSRFAIGDDQTADNAPQFLLLDTDTKLIQGVTKTSDSLTVERNDRLDLPLRRPEEFLRESDRYLAWLSRRWLYNIRSSLATNGMRPLGRLAWFDHKERVERELRSRLAPDQQNGSRRPQVFLVGSISGGTGGMLLDIAKEINRQLQEAEHPLPRVTAIMVHSTTSHPQQRDLANANTFATLNELRHLSCHGETINQKVTLRTAVKLDETWEPLLASYFVSLGQDLDEQAYLAGVSEVADYLYQNVATPLGGLLHSLRKHDTPTATHDVALRSFKLHSIPFPGDSKEDLAALHRLLMTANVPLPNCGYDERLMFLLPERMRPPSSWLESIKKIAEIIPTHHDSPLLCCEAEKLSLAQVAHSLCDEGTDIEEAAYRLHVRRDIDWSRMTRVEVSSG